jgi:hypothetical protein
LFNSIVQSPECIIKDPVALRYATFKKVHELFDAGDAVIHALWRMFRKPGVETFHEYCDQRSSLRMDNGALTLICVS